MARHRISKSTMVDQLGRIIPNGTVTVLATGTSTTVPIYLSATTTTVITGSVVTTDSDGNFDFWINAGLKTDLRFAKTKFKTVTHNHQVQQSEFRYYADALETDQGVEGNSTSIAALLTDIGSTEETVVLTPGTYTVATNIERYLRM